MPFFADTHLHPLPSDADPASGDGRYLFFTNECVGLGHLRRTITLAGAVSRRSPRASSLIVTGSAAASNHALPPGVDTVKLPVLAKDEEGGHRAGRLGIEIEQAVRLRSGLALGAAHSFAPDVAVVDKTPVGLHGELRPALDALKANGVRLVLGLRDIEDAPERVRLSWGGQPGLREAIERYYDAILVYGPESTPDAIDCMGWDLDVPVEHVGYVGAPLPDRGPEDLPDGYLLVTPGGGVDGLRVIQTALEAARLAPLPMPIVVVTGPLMSEGDVARIRELAGGLDVRVFGFRADMDAVVVGARAVVAMAGYNTVSETLRAGRPALLVPRVRPSAEQLVRASSLAAEGMVEMIHPDKLTPWAMRSSLERLLDAGVVEVDAAQFDGARRAAKVLTRLAGRDRAPGRLRIAV